MLEGVRLLWRLKAARAVLMVGWAVLAAGGAKLALAGETVAVPKAGEVFQDCARCPQMVVAPAGSFMMGSPPDELELADPEDETDRPQRRVAIARPFAVGRFAVTVEEFEAFVTETGRKVEGGCEGLSGRKWKKDDARTFRAPGFEQDKTHPVVCVTWDDAKAYVTWLSRMTGQSYRLLTEAEREYVTRAGTATPFWWGTSIAPDRANYDGQQAYPYGPASGPHSDKTVPVTAFQPNPWGLYQVHGNVWEWTEDCWRADYDDDAPMDGSAVATGNCVYRVKRGGGWLYGPWFLRSAFRTWTFTGQSDYLTGFRAVRTLSPLNAPTP